MKSLIIAKFVPCGTLRKWPYSQGTLTLPALSEARKSNLMRNFLGNLGGLRVTSDYSHMKHKFPKGNKLGGRKAGAGVLVQEIRDRCGKIFNDQGVTALEAIVNNPEARPTDVVAACTLLVKVSIPAQSEQKSEVTGNLAIAESAPGTLPDLAAGLKAHGIPVDRWPERVRAWQESQTSPN